MRCPKCEEGELVKIKFTHNNAIAYLCDFCSRFWFDDEEISPRSSGHALKSHSGEKDLEYKLIEIDKKEQDHKPAKYVDYK